MCKPFDPMGAEGLSHISTGFAVSVKSRKTKIFECNSKDIMHQALVFSYTCSPWMQSTHATHVLPPGLAAAD